MRPYKLKAIVLKNKNLGDADRIYTFYTFEKGKVTLKARGVKKIKSKLSSHLETLNYTQIEAVEGRGNLDVITGAVSLNNFKKTKEDISKIADSLYILEIIDKLFTEEHKNENAFYLVKKSLEFLDENKINVNEIFDKWKGIRASVAEEIEELSISCLDILLYNILCAKTPTPSTVLDIWETTKEFFEEIPRMIFEAFFSEKNRLLLQTDKADLNYRKYRGTLDAEVSFEDGSNKKIEILLINNSNIEVVNEILPNSKEWTNAKINIVDDRLQLTVTVKNPSKGSLFLPYRTITATPNLFMAIVPADRAVEISALIYQKYIEQFGKVMGRLPFSIGNIFFGNKIPMFVVLDAGKRMISNFDSLAKEPEKFVLARDKTVTSSNCNFHLKWETKNKLDKTLTWKLPYKLGNCADDYHHPYFIVDTAKDLSSERSSFFKTIAGNVVHFTEIEKGDVLSVHPNYYDFEFLDSNTRRHDITLDKKGRRRSNVANFKSKPFLLDELSQKVMCLWGELLQGKQLKGITDTKLRNLQSLWLTKYQEWQANIEDKTTEAYKQWMSLVTSSIQKEFKDIDDENCNLLLETIESGLFFDTLELYLGILKERIEAN